MVTRFRRYGQIADILIKYGFGIALEKMYPGTTPRSLFRRKKEPEIHLDEYERVRLALEELGPTFIKFGQMVSTRREMLPPELIEELLVLTDKVKPLPFAAVRGTIEEYCGPIGETFAFFEEVPAASASLSQVHRAMLKDGSVVAVKVQRPGIADIIDVDLKILNSLAERVEKNFPEYKIYNPTGIVREFSVQIQKELDFVIDGKNADHLREIVNEVPAVRVPRIHWEYSGKRLLVMEYISGVRIDDVDALRILGFDTKKIANRGIKSYIKQILKYGFFHADPHGGNLMVDMKGDLVFLDFGAIGILRPERRDALVTLLMGFLDNDLDEITASFRDLGVDIDDRIVDSFKDDTYTMLRQYSGYDIREFDLGNLMAQVPILLNRYHLTVPMSLMQALKVIIMVLDTGKKLDPGFHFSEEVGPYIAEIERQSFFSRRTMKNLAKDTFDIVEDFISLPHVINRALLKATDGSIKIEVVGTDISRLATSIDRASNNLLIGLVIAAIVIGSSLMLYLSEEPGGYSYNLAFFGYIMALVIGFVSIYLIWVLKD
ncbi:MAG TPA: AarF/ABC1/UbiB kinase family protein [Methanoculleus sp.]|nr:AarF/ABC1/UbiB kinase family protein [Methanoculleus sp.]